ncbi:MAG: hypothetical protein ACLPVY_14615 [Acidimicrobiia bacterium]
MPADGLVLPYEALGLIVMGLDRTMDPDTRPPDQHSRLRVVDLRVGPGRELHLGGHLAGILADSRERSAAASWISATVAGPRPADADGSIDVDGTVVSVHTLPSPMLAPGQPRVVDQGLLWTQWRSSCARRRDELAAAHASHRLERYRIEAALERARTRPAASTPRPEPAPRPEPDRAAELPSGPEPETGPEGEPDDNAALRSQVQSLIASLDVLPAAPLPEGALLADAWDAHAALVRVRDGLDALPSADVETLEQRVDAARASVAETSAGISDQARLQIEECHRGVVEAEAELFAAKRRHRSRAITNYEHAVAAELVTLADAGLDSHASFLVAVDEGAAASNAAARRLALAELAEARAELDEALQVPDMPTRAELEEREAQMGARAFELLGYAPGTDPAAELRALRVPTEGRAELLDEIAQVLTTAGVVVIGDLVDCARAFVAPRSRQPQTAARDRPATSTPSEPVRVVPAAVTSVRTLDVETLEQQRFAHDRALEQLDTELAAIDAVYNADLRTLPAAELTRAVEVLLDRYRSGALLAGRLPLVLDGALDGLTPAAREAAVKALAGADDLQTIVVSDDVEVMQSLAQTGGTLVRWPAPDPSRRDGSPRQPTPAGGA